jgi:hypothetical protein
MPSAPNSPDSRADRRPAAEADVVMDHRSMGGPALSLAHVPLSEVLPHEYLGAEGELRGLAAALDSHPSAAGRSAWHWYPERREPPQSLGGGGFLLLVATAITVYNTGDDWLELTLDIGWLAPPLLTVSAAVEVACWCPQDHNMHPVRTARWHAADSLQLVQAFATGTAMLTEVLDTGPFDPHPWRVQADLPDAPDTGR